MDITQRATAEEKDGKELVLWSYCNPYAGNQTISKQRSFIFHSKMLNIVQNAELSQREVGEIVWDGAYLLSRLLEKESLTIVALERDESQCIADATSFSLAPNRSILELGAGTGLLGMVAALSGGHVVATDQEVVMGRLRENLSVNASAFNECGGSVQAAELSWGDRDALQTVIQCLPSPSALLTIAADVVYGDCVSRHIALLKTVKGAVRNSGDEMLLAYKPRVPGPEAIFFEKLKQSRNVMKVHPKELPREFEYSNYTVYYIRPNEE